MRTALFLLLAMLAATTRLGAAENEEESEIEVRLSLYFGHSEEDELHVFKLGKEPKTFTLKLEERVQLSMKLTLLGGCRVGVEILRRDDVTGTRPLSWPAFFEPGATFAIGLWQRQEVRGSVSGIGPCSPTAPGK